MKTYNQLNIEVFTDPVFQENGLLLWCGDGPDCWIVDPGFMPQPDDIVAEIRERQLNPVAVMLTHCHPDHIAGVTPIRLAYPRIPIVAPRGEEHLLTDPAANMSLQMGAPVTAPPADRLIQPGDVETLGELEWRMLDVAGHSPAGLAFYCEAAGVVIGGDALFNGGIGRYDFPGSSRERLLKNIRDQLLSLPDQTVLYSGHGPETTIGHERDHNLTLRAELAQ